MTFRSGPERVYRVLRRTAFFVLIVLPCAPASLFAGLVPLFLLEKAGFRGISEPVVFFCCFLVIAVIILNIARGALLTPDAPVGDGPCSRLQSVGLWLVPAFLLWAVFFALAWYFERDAFLWGLPATALAAVFAGVVFPFRRHKNTPVFGCAGPVVAFILFCIGAVLLGRTGRDVTYTGNDVASIPHLFKWQKEHYFPAGAHDIKVRGNTMAFEWECRLSEKDFLDYGRKVKYSFRRIEKKGEGALSREPLPPYYEYRRMDPDGGGLTLRYSVPEEKFRGFYARH
ncbi:MAG: hypothetical protein IJU70_11390 [Lentisphaeria bacterium]|nr:hypothetical protein [Lentisphaeria bacterium]